MPLAGFIVEIIELDKKEKILKYLPIVAIFY